LLVVSAYLLPALVLIDGAERSTPPHDGGLFADPSGGADLAPGAIRDPEAEHSIGCCPTEVTADGFERTENARVVFYRVAT
jgi:hypothetical protein